MIVQPRRVSRLAPLAVVLLALWMTGCAGQGTSVDKTVSIATAFPATGADAAVGQAMQRAVDLAVSRNASLPDGYTLTVAHVDTANSDPTQAAASLAAQAHMLGVVGPLDSQTAAQMLPGIEANGIATISPSATLPGLTQSGAASAEGLSFADLHPKGQPVAFFRLPETDDAAGTAAADLAVAPTQSHGLAAHDIFLVDDGSASGKALASAFTRELKAKGGAVAGQKSLTLGAQDNSQAIISAIVEAYPDAVFYAGGIAGGAKLRSTLSLSGAPQMPILTAGAMADDPDWATQIGVAAAAANTTALLPARDLSTLAKTKDFVSAYQSAYPKQALVPQSALAYDAAMDEIAAIKSVLATGKAPTRAAVLAAVTAAKYAGITGTLAFDKNGDNTTPLGFSIYTCDAKGNWTYQASVGG